MFRLWPACSPARPPCAGARRSVLNAPFLAAAVAVAGCGSPEARPADAAARLATLEADITRLVEQSGQEVGVYYRSLGGAGTDSLLVNPDLRMHAASTMKVPVMIQLFRDDDAGRISLDDRIRVDTTFQSVIDGSPYTLPASESAEETLHAWVGDEVPLRDLIVPMITYSSNLATNLLIEEADAERVTATMREFGADSIDVLRGVQDLVAFDAGYSNTTTARDLGVILAALGRGEAASESATRQMIGILEDQNYRTMIPAGVPDGVRVANKTGSITGIRHDAALVLPDDAPPYVLVVLTRGFESSAPARELAASISRRVWEHHSGGTVAEGDDGA